MPPPLLVSEPVFILIRPQMGENIGAAARAMWNFGLSEMRLVAPRDGWPNPRAEAMASGAGQVLESAGLCETTAEAVADCHLVLATTARARGLTKTVLDPAAAMRLARDRVAAGERVGVLFGPERAGLENADVARATAVISVPVNPEFPSLNLAQCALLVGYEWRRAALELAEERAGGAANAAAATGIPADRSASPATCGDVERLADHWEERLAETGFFWPEEKAPHMRLNLRNLWSRMPLTEHDVRILHGALRQLARRPPDR